MPWAPMHQQNPRGEQVPMPAPPNKGVALDRAGITVFRDITFFAAKPTVTTQSMTC
jgi:hypothetical protein